MLRNKYSVIGLMSGTSLDGVDIAYCKFIKKNEKWSYQIEHAHTVPYSKKWRELLSIVEGKSAFELIEANVSYGHYLGEITSSFIKKHKLKPDFIASHGHTIFHQPNKKITFQLGAGACIAVETNTTTVCDFRTTDVALGGQGAPLVPIGDRLLFSNYNACLNLGGFANISFEKNYKRRAFDVCPVNIVINELCNYIGKKYDNKGWIGKKGKINVMLLQKLNSLAYYQNKAESAKSLGKEWIIQYFNPILKSFEISIEDKIRTLYEHMAIQITTSINTINSKKKASVLVTGGGAYNDFLIERIKNYSNHNIVIPDKKTIEFKEALIFSFLGLLRVREEYNCLKEVTGARKSNVGGSIYLVKKGGKS